MFLLSLQTSEMVNVTYIGDTLVARKVTGDKNVPAGEITFQCDLRPSRTSSTTLETNGLSNLELSPEASKKWGTRQLQRFSGLGHVAEEGFKNNQWVEGQLVMVSEEYFSFTWVPLGIQIFFGRPSPELALKMIREKGTERIPTLEDDVSLLKEHMHRCLDVTDEVLDGVCEGQADSCIYYDGEDVCYS